LPCGNAGKIQILLAHVDGCTPELVPTFQLLGVHISLAARGIGVLDVETPCSFEGGSKAFVLFLLRCGGRLGRAGCV
jgi:hypothetical protein